MPNQPKTPMRSFRVSKEEWALWKAAAEAAGLPVSDYIKSVMNPASKRRLRHKETP